MAQSRFRSRSEHVLDGKGRLHLPSRFRDVLKETNSQILMVTPWNNHLRAYRLAEWENLETKLMDQGGEQGIADFVRYTIGSVVECAVDKQWRIRLPVDLRVDAKLSKDIILTGMMDWFEICDKDTAQAEKANTRDNFDSFQPGLNKMRIF